jgi:hypothetical protein
LPQTVGSARWAFQAWLRDQLGAGRTLGLRRSALRMRKLLTDEGLVCRDRTESPPYCPAVGMPICGLMPCVHVAFAAKPNVLPSVACQTLIASRAQLEPLTRILATALASNFVDLTAHCRAFSNTRRPAAVIRTRATSIAREPARLSANPCACRMPSGQPLSQDASNSSARMRSGLMSPLRCRVRIVRYLPGCYRFNRHRDTSFQSTEPNSPLNPLE